MGAEPAKICWNRWQHGRRARENLLEPLAAWRRARENLLEPLAAWRRARENLLEPLAAWRRAREAGGRIKPGAQAPGKPPKKRAQPVERATAQMRRRAVARFTGSTPYFYYDPGACAPGFMPSPASRALSSFIPASRLSVALFPLRGSQHWAAFISRFASSQKISVNGSFRALGGWGDGDEVFDEAMTVLIK